MTDPFSLKSLLACALGQATQSMGQIGQVEPTPFSLSTAVVQSSLWLNLRRSTLDYISALPLKLAALSADPNAGLNALGEADRIAQMIIEGQSSSQVNRNLADRIWQWVEMDALPSGQLRLRLPPAGLALWLEHWIWCSEETLATVNGSPTLPTPPFSGKELLAQQLKLKPLTVMQYLYARCHWVCQMYGDASPPPPPLWNVDGGCYGQGWLPPESRNRILLGTLVQMVDHLADPNVAVDCLLGKGYQLAEATESWMESLPSLRTLERGQWALLAGVKRALHTLLMIRCGYLLPQGL